MSTRFVKKVRRMDIGWTYRLLRWSLRFSWEKVLAILSQERPKKRVCKVCMTYFALVFMKRICLCLMFFSCKSHSITGFVCPSVNRWVGPSIANHFFSTYFNAISSYWPSNGFVLVFIVFALYNKWTWCGKIIVIHDPFSLRWEINFFAHYIMPPWSWRVACSYCRNSLLHYGTNMNKYFIYSWFCSRSGEYPGKARSAPFSTKTCLN